MAFHGCNIQFQSHKKWTWYNISEINYVNDFKLILIWNIMLLDFTKFWQINLLGSQWIVYIAWCIYLTVIYCLWFTILIELIMNEIISICKTIVLLHRFLLRILPFCHLAIHQFNQIVAHAEKTD